jgi:hypothetical protein
MRKAVLDQYREELIELKDKLSATKIADHLLEKHGITIGEVSILKWYAAQGLTKEVKPKAGYQACHGARHC